VKKYTLDEKTVRQPFNDEGNDFLEETLTAEGILPEGQSSMILKATPRLCTMSTTPCAPTSVPQGQVE
jgi:hypothetical protein